MPARLSHDFPLFPLGLVALPGELIPLHIFEERYKTMMSECLERFGWSAVCVDGFIPPGAPSIPCGIGNSVKNVQWREDAPR